MKYTNCKNGITVVMEQGGENGRVVTVLDGMGNISRREFDTVWAGFKAYQNAANEAMKNEKTFDDVMMVL